MTGKVQEAHFWLLKSEPLTWSWQNQLDAQTTSWDGVRSYQAAKNLKSMKVGDLAFFYHSGRAPRVSREEARQFPAQYQEKSIMGIVQISKEYYPDPSDSTGRFGMVDVVAHSSLPNPVPLSLIKTDPSLVDLALVRQSRLSVMPIPPHQWALLLDLGKLHSDSFYNVSKS